MQIRVHADGLIGPGKIEDEIRAALLKPTMRPNIVAPLAENNSVADRPAFLVLAGLQQPSSATFEDRSRLFHGFDFSPPAVRRSNCLLVSIPGGYTWLVVDA